jgi:branched-chain amino acid transport system substrate-binding protein
MTRTIIVGMLLATIAFGWVQPVPAVEFVFRGSQAAAPAEADPVLPLTALAESRAAAGEPLQALLFIYQALDEVTGARSADLLAQSHDLLQHHLDDSQLAEAAFMFRGTPLGQDALLQQAVRAAARGDRTAALRLAESVVEGDPPFPYRSEAVRLWEQLTGQSWQQRTIGVLLPLSGRFAAFGDLVRRGMELALVMHQEVRQEAGPFYLPGHGRRSVAERAGRH